MSGVCSVRERDLDLHVTMTLRATRSNLPWLHEHDAARARPHARLARQLAASSPSWFPSWPSRRRAGAPGVAHCAAANAARRDLGRRRRARAADARAAAAAGRLTLSRAAAAAAPRRHAAQRRMQPPSTALVSREQRCPDTARASRAVTTQPSRAARRRAREAWPSAAAACTAPSPSPRAPRASPSPSRTSVPLERGHQRPAGQQPGQRPAPAGLSTARAGAPRRAGRLREGATGGRRTDASGCPATCSPSVALANQSPDEPASTR